MPALAYNSCTHMHILMNMYIHMHTHKKQPRTHGKLHNDWVPADIGTKVREVVHHFQGTKERCVVCPNPRLC